MPAAPQAARAQAELGALEGAFAELALEPAAAALAPQLEGAQRDLRWLEGQAPRWAESPALAELVGALAAHRQLLGELRPLETEQAQASVQALIRDVHVKAEQCRHFGGPVPVNVSVVTRDANNREVTGYEVWFVRKAYERRSTEFRRFERNSSPAERRFQEAGYYVLWAAPPGQGSTGAGRAGSTPDGARLDVEVGADQRDQVFDLIAPAPEPRSDAHAEREAESLRP